MFTCLQSILPKFSIEIDFSLRIYKVKSKFQKVFCHSANWPEGELTLLGRIDLTRSEIGIFPVFGDRPVWQKVSVTVVDFGGEM